MSSPRKVLTWLSLVSFGEMRARSAACQSPKRKHPNGAIAYIVIIEDVVVGRFGSAGNGRDH